MLALELGLANQISLKQAAVASTPSASESDDTDAVALQSPLAEIPKLLLNECHEFGAGQCEKPLPLFDCRVICEFLHIIANWCERGGQ